MLLLTLKTQGLYVKTIMVINETDSHVASCVFSNLSLKGVS
jgi:hypothetical protein